MNQGPRIVQAAATERSGPSPAIIDSVTLLGGRREVIIRHGDELYRLRVTASNKLILTK